VFVESLVLAVCFEAERQELADAAVEDVALAGSSSSASA
jgi:hypothetical protein